MASVLHLGNTHFAADEESNAQVTTENQLKYLTRVRRRAEGKGRAAGAGELCPHQTHPLPWQLLGVEGSTLREALTHRKIIAKGEEVRPGGGAGVGGRCSKAAPTPTTPHCPGLLSWPSQHQHWELTRQEAQRGTGSWPGSHGKRVGLEGRLSLQEGDLLFLYQFPSGGAAVSSLAPLLSTGLTGAGRAE